MSLRKDRSGKPMELLDVVLRYLKETLLIALMFIVLYGVTVLLGYLASISTSHKKGLEFVEGFIFYSSATVAILLALYATIETGVDLLRASYTALFGSAGVPKRSRELKISSGPISHWVLFSITGVVTIAFVVLLRLQGISVYDYLKSGFVPHSKGSPELKGDAVAAFAEYCSQHHGVLDAPSMKCRFSDGRVTSLSELLEQRTVIQALP